LKMEGGWGEFFITKRNLIRKRKRRGHNERVRKTISHGGRKRKMERNPLVHGSLVLGG